MIVLAYTWLGGLTSAIHNEVLQFFLIVSWAFRRCRSLSSRARADGTGFRSAFPPSMTHAWQYMGSPAQNPMGIETLRDGWRDLGSFLSFG